MKDLLLKELKVYSHKAQESTLEFIEEKINVGKIEIEVPILLKSITLGKAIWYSQSTINLAVETILLLFQIMCRRRRINPKELNPFSVSKEDLRELKKKIISQGKRWERQKQKSRLHNKPKFSQGRRSILRQFIGFLLKNCPPEQREPLTLALIGVPEAEPSKPEDRKSVV